MLLSNIIAVNSGNYSSEEFSAMATRAAGLAVVIFILQWIATVLNPWRILLLLGLMLTPLLVYATLISFESIGAERAAPLEVHPNWWGELLFCYSVCALAMPNRVIKWVMLGVTFLLFYLVQSRGALLASLVMIGVYGASTIQSNLVRPKHYLYGSIVLSCVVMVLLWRFGFTTILDFLTDDVMRLDDSYRGLDSAFVGREEGWALAWETFLANPIFGQGLDTMTQVHNGFLRLAAEGGLIMLVVVLGLTWFGIVNTRRTGNRLGFAIIVGYLVMVLLAPRFLNTNLASIVFFMSIFPWRTTGKEGQTNSKGGVSEQGNFMQALRNKGIHYG